MADKKISELTAAATPGETDLLEVVQQAQTPKSRKLTLAALRDWLPGGRVKRYVALLTQYAQAIKGYGQTLRLGERYIIMVADSHCDFTNVGAANNSSGTEFIATGTTPASWGDNHLATVQSDGSPIATILENTLGEVTYQYTGGGGGIATFEVISPAFVAGKTIARMVVAPNSDAGSAGVTCSGTEINGSIPDDWGNNLSYQIPIEILVYP